ncbi:MAG: cytochrome P460 family protein [Chitinophagales bacterium]|nr:cytochrome P460 family protein [Chitinophagales bacterium]
MKKTILTTVAGAALLLISLQSCKKEKATTTTTPQPNPEYIADNNSFKGFEGWHLHTTKNGVDPANLGPAHAGDDSTSVRKVYFEGGHGVTRSNNGQFPIGTLVSKITTWNSGGGGSMITAMAKRGNGFDPSGNDWEYFVLNADGSIVVDNGTTMRGANIMNSACKNCHAKVKNNDYIFTK